MTIYFGLAKINTKDDLRNREDHARNNNSAASQNSINLACDTEPGNILQIQSITSVQSVDPIVPSCGDGNLANCSNMSLPIVNVLDTTQPEICNVCNQLASKHIHYGGRSCQSCRAFFRRSVVKYTRLGN